MTSKGKKNWKRRGKWMVKNERESEKEEEGGKKGEG